jgi:hypothetical protein
MSLQTSLSNKELALKATIYSSSLLFEAMVSFQPMQLSPSVESMLTMTAGQKRVQAVGGVAE